MLSSFFFLYKNRIKNQILCEKTRPSWSVPGM
nr:MAG TPA: hypothetical protein [Caudoviricetes sp.]